MLQHAGEVAWEHRFLEFRLDSVPDPAAVVPVLEYFLTAHPDVTALATCRRAAFGGAFRGSAQEQVGILSAAARAGCRLIDAEVETAEELGPDMLAALHHAGTAVILSWHDFDLTPELEPVFDRLQVFAPDFIKIVPTAQTLTDSLRLLDLLERHAGNGNLIAMSMSQKGVLTRVLGPRFGSAFTFAAREGSSGTATGQVGADTLRDLYRIGHITEQTTVYAVAGSPIGASLSPLMHNTALRVAGLDAVYLPLETADAHELLHTARQLAVQGLSITMPLKEAVLPLLDSRDTAVSAMAACNTLVRGNDGTLAGLNTDVAGIIGPLEQRMALREKRVLVLGAGGAARAAVFGLRQRGAEVFLLNRTVSRAEALAAEAGAHVQSRETLRSTHFNVIINSTPFGMRDKNMAPPIAPDEMNCDLFFDLVYNPLKTPLMQLAEDRGIPTLPGAAMFVAQGTEQFRIWTGRQAPEEDMLHVVIEALRER